MLCINITGFDLEKESHNLSYLLLWLTSLMGIHKHMIFHSVYQHVSWCAFAARITGKKINLRYANKLNWIKTRQITPSLEQFLVWLCYTHHKSTGRGLVCRLPLIPSLFFWGLWQSCTGVTGTPAWWSALAWCKGPQLHYVAPPQCNLETCKITWALLSLPRAPVWLLKKKTQPPTKKEAFIKKINNLPP